MAGQGREPGESPDKRLLRPGGKVDPAALERAIRADEDPDAEAAPIEGVPDDDAPNRVVFKLQRDLQKRLDKYLSDRIGFMSRTQLQRLIDEGGVSVNGRRPKASTVLRLGDRIEVFVPPPPPQETPAQDIPLTVLFEDEHLIVLNKPSDIIVHPARSHLSGTMINALAYHFQHRSPSGGALSTVGKEFARPGVVHRLDRNTTGAIVFAKNDEAHWKLAQQFERRTVDKRYVAVVHGHVEPAIDVIEHPIGPHPSREKGYREKYVVRHDALGKPAVTIYRVLGRYGSPPPPRGPNAGPPADTAFSLVEVELKTGRTHQIRVHFSHNGYPLVGDDMYGGRFVTLDGVGFERQALHAATLAFTHPISNRKMHFTAPLPADLARLVRSLRAKGPVWEAAVPPPGSTLVIDTLLAGAEAGPGDARPPANG